MITHLEPPFPTAVTSVPICPLRAPTAMPSIGKLSIIDIADFTIA